MPELQLPSHRRDTLLSRRIRFRETATVGRSEPRPQTPTSLASVENDRAVKSQERQPSSRRRFDVFEKVPLLLSWPKPYPAVEPCLDISLEVKNCNSIEKALARFTKLEILDDENKYRCKTLVQASKRMTILEAPATLVLQLKRFEFGHYGLGGKITKMITFQEKLDLQPFMYKADSRVVYDLYGVLVHSGHSCNSGHYYSFVKAPNGIWFLKNDSEVRQVSISKVLEQHAYILFYTSRNSTPSPETFTSFLSEKKTLPFNPSIIRDHHLTHSTSNWKVSIADATGPTKPTKSVTEGRNVTAESSLGHEKGKLENIPAKKTKSEFSVGEATSTVVPWEVEETEALLQKRDILMMREGGKKMKRPSDHDLEYDQGKTKKRKKKRNQTPDLNRAFFKKVGEGGDNRVGAGADGRIRWAKPNGFAGRDKASRHNGGFSRKLTGHLKFLANIFGQHKKNKKKNDRFFDVVVSDEGPGRKTNERQVRMRVHSGLHSYSLRRKPDLIDILRSEVLSTEIALTFLPENGPYLNSPEIHLESLERERTIPLPDVLYEQYDFLQCRCFLGLFPEIHRAWITIDHQLFLWNYDSPDEFEVFDDQDQVIVSVGLVKPLPGVFLDEINHLLVVATPIEIILVAVAHKEEKGVSNLNLYRTAITIASDNISMTSIVGSANGRIFMCGSNGRLYELQYQADEGWFTRKCRIIDLTVTTYSMRLLVELTALLDPIQKIVVDVSRNILYALTERSNISLYYLGDDGKGFKFKERQTDIFSQAQKWLEGYNMYPHPYLDPRNFHIVGIHVIPMSESSIVHLMAVSSSGYRLFFACHKQSYQNQQKLATKEPTFFQLVFVRPPPQNRERMRLHESSYANGTLLSSNAINDDSDSVTCFSIDRVTSSELFGFEKIEGKTWSICEKARRRSPTCAEDYMIEESFVKRNIVLTNAGIKEYASSNVISWAQRLYFEIGGKPSLRQENSQQRVLDNGPLGRPLTSNEYDLSGRHEGLALYFARLLAPLWKETLVKKVPGLSKGVGRGLGWKTSQNVLGSIADSLAILNKLLDDTPSLTAPPSPNEIDYSSIGTSQSVGEKEAWQEEKASMRNLHALIKRVIEGINFIMLLMDFKFLSLADTFVPCFQKVFDTEVHGSLEDKLVKYLLEESFESLVTLNIGIDLGRQIFTKIIQVKIKQDSGDHRESQFSIRQKCYQLVKSVILSVELPAAEESVADAREVDKFRESLINYGLGFDDKLFHYFIFDWFMEERLYDRLLKLNSRYLEDFLAFEPIAFERINLLWKFYVHQEAFMKAAQVLNAMASSKIYGIPFIQRLELLQLAVANARSATVTVADHDFFRELEDKRDVALVQMEIVAAVSKMNGVLPADDVLFDSLLTISDLFLHYAKPLNLHEICLLIFHTADNKDRHLISQTWLKIIKEGTSSSDKLLLLEETIKNLGMKYAADANVFPLAFICTQLETQMFQNPFLRTAAGGDFSNDGISWVIRIMRFIGVSFTKLFEIYYDMSETRNPPWNTATGEQFITAKLTYLISEWCKSVETSLVERTRFPAKSVDDALCKLLLSSGATSGGSSTGGISQQQAQIKELKELQDKVRKTFL
ncbi:hypothetical protein HDU82_007868 [Entophlyctis luteolus]|nr:hypothetical protein HDU82_007868 [Entophlyctis luteolus]